MAAVPIMYVGEQLAPLLLRDASKRNSIGALAVEVAIPQAVRPGLAGHTLCLFVILQEGATLQVSFELAGPAFSLWLQRQQQASA
jgi:hypothetical protein